MEEEKTFGNQQGCVMAGGDVGCNIVFGMIRNTADAVLHRLCRDKRSNSRTGNVTFQML